MKKRLEKKWRGENSKLVEVKIFPTGVVLLQKCRVAQSALGLDIGLHTDIPIIEWDWILVEINKEICQLCGAMLVDKLVLVLQFQLDS